MYTKLYCFLPWIAGQYGLQYTVPATDADCYTSTGDINDVSTVERCFSTRPVNIEQEFLESTFPCIFPFYLNGVRYDSCVLFSNTEVVYPINRCPIRNITTKIDGLNSYNASSDSDLIQSYEYCTNEALQYPGDLLPPLDPSINDCNFFERRSAFSTCKNNCLGGKALDLVERTSIVFLL